MQVDLTSGDVQRPADSWGRAPGIPSLVPSHRFEEERKELERVLQSPGISRSASLVRFLTYICNKHFEGKSAEIREYSIAVEALGRKGSSFDSRVDPIVRVTARTLRKKLQEFYQNDEPVNGLQIVLPLGHYVPQFLRQGENLAGASLPDGDSPPDFPEGDEQESGDWSKLSFGSGWFAGARSRVILMGLSITVAALAIFLAGYFAGRHGTRQVPMASRMMQWGDPVWSDNFDGAAHQLPDPAKWTFDAVTQWSSSKHDLETYCSPRGAASRNCDPRLPNAFLDGDGHLVLRAERNANGSWTSARIATLGLKDIQYGRIEARMKFPVGKGLWPSLSMMGSDVGNVGWPESGSVDIVENVSMVPGTNGLGPSMIRSTLHGPRYFGSNGLWHDFKFHNGARVDDGSFHTYGIIWSPGMIQFYVDDPSNVFFVQDADGLPEGGKWVFDHPFFLVLNLAVGGDWPGDPDATTPNPADMVVDYVRVYKIPTVAAPTIELNPIKVKAASSAANIISLRAHSYTGRVHLACSTEPATVTCSLGNPIVNFSGTLSQEDTLTIATESYTENGKLLAPPGHYKVTITATTISGDNSQITVPIEVVNGD